jgi:hypothetical protein
MCIMTCRQALRRVVYVGGVRLVQGSEIGAAVTHVDSDISKVRGVQDDVQDDTA